MALIIDASVALKWFLPEAQSDTARALLQGDELLVAPAHMFAEVGQVLSRHVRAGKLTRDEAIASLDGLAHTLVVVQLPPIVREALTIATGAGTSYYDALYVAAAEHWGAMFVTADDRLLRNLAGSVWAHRVRGLSQVAGWAS